MSDDPYSTLVERVSNVIEGLKEFKNEVREINKNIIENASRDRERWATILKENTKEIMSTVEMMQTRRDVTTQAQFEEYKRKIVDLESKGTSTRELVLKIVGGILAIIGMWALLQNVLGVSKSLEAPRATPPKAQSMEIPPPEQPPIYDRRAQ